MASAASMDSILRKVLSQGGKEQSAMYPPHVYQEHFNVATNYILDEGVKLFPGTSSVLAVMRPFMHSVELPVIKGSVAFQEDYRNLLGVAINVTDDFSKDCGCKDDVKYENDPLADSEKKKRSKLERAKCLSYDIDMLDIDEYGRRTRHLYKKPTLKNAIGCIIKGEEIKVCPYDLSFVEVRYIRKPKEYVYGYKELPDHTYVFDAATTVESEWKDTAMQYLLKGITALYSIYTRDGEVQNWNEAIKKVGLF